MRRTAAAIGAVLLAASTLTLSSGGASAWTRSPTRIAGAHRYDTAASLSVAAFPDGADAAVIASGTSFPDGLAAGPLAAHLDGPILLTEQAALPQATANELARLEPERVVIVGGEAAVAPEVAQAIEDSTGVTPERVAGDTRYDTAIAVAQQLADNDAGIGEGEVVYVASGELFADALTGGAVAAQDGQPVLLTQRDALPVGAVAFLRSKAAAEIVILGGTASVSQAVEDEIDAAVDGDAVVRVAGPDRYSTAAELASQRLPDHDEVLLAAGMSFPDALAAAPLARALGAPILLVDRRCAPYPTVERVRDADFPDVTAVGGSAVVGDAAVRLEPCSHAVDDGELAPGVELQTYELPGPIVARVVTFERDSGWDLRVASASGRLIGRRAMSDIARRWDALAAINGDFFHETGEVGTPVHVMASAGRLYRAPGVVRTAIGWGADDEPVFVGTPELDMTFDLPDSEILVTRYNSGVPEGEQVAMYTAEGASEVDLGIETCRAEIDRDGAPALDDEGDWSQRYTVGEVECGSGPFEVGATDVIVARADTDARDIIEDLEEGADATFRWRVHPNHPGTGDIVGADTPLVFAAQPAPGIVPGGMRAPRTAIG
ncbi:MAG TPA: cell wall-binding repeat-containing protein, partial [Acidimicrobiales bacterium]|nr:cell wall-binding repeat-containing protein [Acidimicrobiales bacterium]